MRRSTGFLILGLVIAWLAIPYGGSTQPSGKMSPKAKATNPSEDESLELAPFVPTPMEVVEKMLELAQVKSSDVLYDLGSGDGRIVITAAEKYGARAVGFEIDPELVEESRDNARREGVSHLVEIRQQDLMTADFSAATVVTIYLHPESNLLVRPLLRSQLKPGSRVVSNDFDMGDWKPDVTGEAVDSLGDIYTVYLWRIRKRDSGPNSR